ncbi:type II toxin-antitoxin system prevent-host-death family antitoxin [Rhizobium sp. DKSPLA3]|uniref:Antitoxin n=1 Tax=Rhizobium quercicola TaxID=2901226 RepID=A0A9X1NQL1_9HYPH|nr:type II toxin-antitoxin system prevent-host-death family antitoxin [Rhizobium quercicola]MCD7109110.1 type II toxin-antitoxin system prevent-host-death family antitoxin [Rhizobium quercicola]
MKIGAFEAKAQFSALLEKAAHGEDVTITKHGKSIARLVAIDDDPKRSGQEIVAALKALRKTETLGELSWKDLRDEGRR